MLEKKWNMDRLSVLPDCLLHIILSHLNSQEVVQTCVLSKRWKSLWTFIPTINFDLDCQSASQTISFSKLTSFKRFLLAFLSHHCGENIQQLNFTSINTPLYEEQKLLIEFCICYAKTHMVPQLCINIPNVSFLDWRYCLSNSKSLTVLKMCCGFVDDWGSLTLPCLKTLEIKYKSDYYDEITNLHGENMFEGCPNLVSLVMENFICDHLRIFGPKLENLELCCSFETEIDFQQLELLTPSLKCVKFTNILVNLKPNFNLESVEKVSLVANKEFHSKVIFTNKRKVRENVFRFLRVFQNANSLTISLPLLQAILVYRSLHRYLLLRKLRHLRLKTEGTNNKIDLPINLLPCFPGLKTWVVDLPQDL